MESGPETDRHWRSVAMAGVSLSSAWRLRRGELLFFWLSIAVPSSLLQSPPSLSLPVQMSIVPPPWQIFPLSQADLGTLFSNSSPFSYSQSLFTVSPSDQSSRPRLQASFGSHSVTQLVSESVLPLPPPLSASVLSDNVARERDEQGQETFRVRALFHKRGIVNTEGTCITLHAFKDTKEHKASCITQPPLGLCVVTLTLPSDWFEDQHANQSHLDLNVHLSRRAQKQHRGRHHNGYFVNRQRRSSLSLRYRPGADGDAPKDALRAPIYQRGPMKNQIQLYYSSFDAVDHLKPTPPGCVEGRAAESQRQLFHIKAVTLKERQEDKGRDESRTDDACSSELEEELSVDSHVVIRYHKGPVLIGQPLKVSVNLRANFSGQFVVIRLKVKKGLVSMVVQRTWTSDLWAVTLERSQGSKHDVVSIFCHKHSPLKKFQNPTILQQVVCLSVDGLRQSFGVAMTVTAKWWVEYSGRGNPLSSHGTAPTVFSFADRHIFGIVPITESNTIINTAILTNQPVSLPVIVLAVSNDEMVSDVTSAVTCHSASENTVKVSSDCSALFVDGSESRLGNTCAVVEFSLGRFRGSVCLEVWAPTMPLRVSLEDPVLNAIDGWNLFTEEGCVPVYQRSSVHVLTQFTAQDTHGRTTHLLGSLDWFMDVTDLVSNWLRVEDPQVASLGPQNILIGLRPGKTSLHVISEQWDGVLGRCDVTVTSDAVTPGDLSVQVVSGLGMSVMTSPAHSSIITTTVTAYNILYNHHQEASISVWLQFSDDTASLLSSFDDLPFSLHLSSLAESVVVVTPSPSQRIFAQGDGGGPLLQAELLVSTCADQLITSNSIREGDSEWTDSKGGRSTTRLARGSGWIRVNLDLGLGFLHPIGKKDEEGEEFEFDISDMLVDSDSVMYTSNKDESRNASDYYEKIRMPNGKWNEGNGGMVSRNTLERAVLMPSLEEGTVYFSPSNEKKGLREEEKGGWGDHDLEIGMGAVLSLLCLSVVLFLANCLPCALQDRRRTRTVEKREGELEGGIVKEEEIERNEVEDGKQEEMNTTKDELTMKQEENSAGYKEQEIIC